jgi:Pilus assembly protein, PilO
VTTSQKKLTPKTIALLAALLVGVVAVAGWFVLVGPQRSKVTSLEAKIADEHSKLAAARIVARSQKSGKPSSTGPGMLVRAMPAQLQMPSVVRQVQQLAASSKVTVESFTPSASTAAAGYDEVPIQVSVAGRYASVKQFLHALRVQAGTTGSRIHASGRLFDVQSVGLTPDTTDATGQPNELTAAISLVTFVYTGAPLPDTSTTETDTTASDTATTGEAA